MKNRIELEWGRSCDFNEIDFVVSLSIGSLALKRLMIYAGVRLNWHNNKSYSQPLRQTDQAIKETTLNTFISTSFHSMVNKRGTVIKRLYKNMDKFFLAKTVRYWKENGFETEEI
ncbi:hypothetical protein [Streptococcus merionis]|uniref:hypothetical protein n=1 Tax=Streptococcus merionis TaxID=400065 RepID=UPI0026EAC2C6|nr:hypothetical protein [Streptococcus merionis]